MALLVGHQPRLVLTLFLLPYLLFSCLYGLFIRESPMLPIIYPPSPPLPFPSIIGVPQMRVLDPVPLYQLFSFVAFGWVASSWRAAGGATVPSAIC